MPFEGSFLSVFPVSSAEMPTSALVPSVEWKNLQILNKEILKACGIRNQKNQEQGTIR